MKAWNFDGMAPRKFATFVTFILMLASISICFAESTGNYTVNQVTYQNRSTYDSDSEEGPADERAKKENKIPPHFFAIVFYKPTYIIPAYYTGSPYNSIYKNSTPNNEGIKRWEMKYQLSFKVPVWKRILNRNTTLYLAYTQLSYWQAYNKTAFFRETDYEPELYLANEVNWPFMFRGWHVSFLNVGAVHQSNGYGNQLERSWNRLYIEIISSKGSWMVSIKPWIAFHDSSLELHNPDITDFLGYGQLLIVYKYFHQVFSLQAHNLIESGGRRATAEFTWSFPITPYLNGYVQIFSGYGQSLIEYNHRTNSAGIGIAFNNWV